MPVFSIFVFVFVICVFGLCLKRCAFVIGVGELCSGVSWFAVWSASGVRDERLLRWRGVLDS